MTARFQGLDLLWPDRLTKTDKEGIRTEVLLKSSKDAYLVSNNFDLDPSKGERLFFAAGDTQGQYDLGYALYGTFPGYFDPAEKSAETRIMVIGTSMFPSNIVQYSDSSYNMAFLGNVAEWLSSDDDLLAIKTRFVRDMRLNKIEEPQGKMRAFFMSQLVNLVFVPILVIAFGLNRFLKRRKKQNLQNKEA